MNNRELAKLAGVSPGTISKIFSGNTEISIQTAERVKQLARENNWIPPKYRRHITEIQIRNKHIAIFVPELISPYYAAHATAAVNEFREYGIEPAIYISGFSRSSFKILAERLIKENMADGILSIEMLNAYSNPRVPIVYTTSSGFQPTNDAGISSNQHVGIKNAVRFLKQSGHQRIGFIGEKYTLDKYREFCIVIDEENLPKTETDSFISDKRFEEVGYEAVDSFMKRKAAEADFSMPTAFLCAYDEIALGLIHRFSDYGVKVPDQVSVIGMNNIPSAAYASVPLTTIDSYFTDRMKNSVCMLLHMIDNSEYPTVFNASQYNQLVIRDSVAPLHNTDANKK